MSDGVAIIGAVVLVFILLILFGIIVLLTFEIPLFPIRARYQYRDVIPRPHPPNPPFPPPI